MAYRSLCLFGALLLAAPVWAAPAPQKIALVVDGGGARHDELQSGLSKALGAEVASPASMPSDDAALKALRLDLKATRVVILRVVEQGPGLYTLEARAVDAGGVTHRFSDAGTDDVVAKSQALVAQLPPLPIEETKPPEPAVEAAPAPAAIAEPVTTPATPPTPTPHQRWVKKHPSDMLIAGAITFLVPYFTTVGFAASYQSYNPNAASVGYLPLAGPFLARQRINDKDLSDGYDPGLLVDGIVQVLTFNLLVAGIIYCAVGEKRLEVERSVEHVQVRPLVGVGGGSASLGAVVTW